MVQGVGFRYFTQKQASLHSINGWVRNCPDGAVEIEAEGDEDNLSFFIGAIEQGPSFSRVTKIDISSLDKPRGLRGFDITY